MSVDVQAGQARSGASRRRSLVVLGSVLGLVAVWALLATWSRHQVEVARVGAVECTGTEVSEQGGTPVIALEPGMRCEVVVRVRNDGFLPVRLDSLTVPLAGSQGGAAFRVSEHPADDDVAAVLIVGSTVDPGEADDVGFTVVFRDGGCTADGRLTVRDFPRATVSTLGLTGSRSSGQAFIFLGTPASACDG